MPLSIEECWRIIEMIDISLEDGFFEEVEQKLRDLRVKTKEYIDNE